MICQSSEVELRQLTNTNCTMGEIISAASKWKQLQRARMSDGLEQEERHS